METNKEKYMVTLEQIRQENQFLKETEKCVICQDQPRNRVILPCSHFCTCHLCVPALTHCPYTSKEGKKCRALIQGIICIYR